MILLVFNFLIYLPTVNMRLPQQFFILSLLTVWLTSFASATNLPDDEVQALKDIAKTLGKKDWNFQVDPCSGGNGWLTPNPVRGDENNVTCVCSFLHDNNATVCHVTNILLKGQNLQGTLPRELVRLPYLQEIDLSRNYLNGTIPKEWGSLNHLVNVSLIGNRLTGPIPAEIGNLISLRSMVLEFNQLSGHLPPELGNVSQIRRLFLTSNNFSGEIPATFARLTRLIDFRIGGNQFSGKIPSFIGSWTSLVKLVIQGSGLSGPIPSEISFLHDMTDLRISDLNGPDSTFPQLARMTGLKTLILRSCNITGTLPEYLGTMTSIKSLDLSFNKLTGQIPSTYAGLRKAGHVYLTGNLLSGPVPEWVERSGFVMCFRDYILNYILYLVHRDLSYNNFSVGKPGQLTCKTGNVNLFSSTSTGNDSGTVPCLRGFHCPKTWYSLHINCGGQQLTQNGGTTFEEDSDGSGSARFDQSETNWIMSSTGYFLDKERIDYYTVRSASALSMTNAELYMDARVSPLSVSYFAFCMGNGNYTVKLHFAEIMFTDDKTYSSLGRRVFDVYIQGKLVLKDFNIAEEAGGVGKAVIKEFTGIVTGNSLEIRLYWAGKGTTAIPYKSLYGPLISAISVDPDFKPPSENGSSISGGTVAGIVVTGAAIVILVFGVLWWRGSLGPKNSLARELKSLDLQTGIFTLRQIKAATNNFDVANKIGEGGFGPVYKGFLSDGTVIAVKQLSSKSKQGNKEFINEIGMISAMQHPCLVKLYGCCVERDQLLLVYEYMDNNSLARALFGQEGGLHLDWPTRYRICIGIARGLAFLHEESRLKIVHRDIKATNVLLDKDLNPKISDFGLAKLYEEDNSHVSTRIAGTYGYMAPEYAMHGHLSDKTDVYSFGIVALEIVSGRSNNMNHSIHLLEWAHFLKENDNLMEIVDPKLKSSKYIKAEAMVMINVAFLCTNVTASLRPTMSSVVSMLEDRTVREVDSDASEVLDEMKMRKYYPNIGKNSISVEEGSCVDSPTSVTDLYPVHLDSSYWMKRN
ncbi:probable leucine-rich repeat receptor-like serine/threonine-protein kinase At3g14840 isoform X2 [Prosopis cineraria]|uniref:probable leucine-rich repeat receptor-like serine/threonine-protein kinase At3g14840 isoform X2 n=1 Tax=Prosopis cineraria TaxID=364024 RepID=UPI00240FEFBE|nr:probable leucine-rich repeat receptor-like serine/threonine-protein kinase At3g14840 isoform X2 [Prosopis cineraria]